MRWIAVRIAALLVRMLARTRFQRLNTALFTLSIRGLGMLNYRNLEESGEAYFLKKVLPCYYGSGTAARAVVLDVGANVGNYSRTILKIAPDARVYCFEPHPANVSRLESALGSSVTVVPVAVGSAPGTLELFDYEGTTGSSHASLHKEVFEQILQRPHHSQCVPVTTIDEFVEQRGIDAIALLKVDVEGHEYEVLKGAARVIRERKVDLVQFEFNEMNVITRVFLADFFALLPGFAFYRLLPTGWLPITERPIENVFAFQNIVAVRVAASVYRVFATRHDERWSGSIRVSEAGDGEVRTRIR